MIIHGAQRLWTPKPGGGGIVGKPIVPFSPATGSAYYPNDNALFFTDLISGETDYIADSVGAGVFTYNTGTMGYHTEGEGFKVVVNGNTDGGITPVNTGGTRSWAILLECYTTDAKPGGGTFNYLHGWSKASGSSVSTSHSNCSNTGLASYSSALLCLGDIADKIVRIAIKQIRAASGAHLVIVVDGTVLHDVLQDNYEPSGYYLGRNTYGRGDTLVVTGFWQWREPYDGADPLPQQDMIDLTTDPWPLLVTLD